MLTSCCKAWAIKKVATEYINAFKRMIYRILKKTDRAKCRNVQQSNIHESKGPKNATSQTQNS
jgi:hypothetical protein